MKKIFKNYLSVIAIIIAVIVTLYFALIFRSIQVATFSEGSSSSITTPDDRFGDTAFGGLFYSPYIPDTIPHNKYKKKEDSINQIRNRIELDNKSVGGTGVGVGMVGVSAMSKLPADFSEYLTPKIDRQLQSFVDKVGKMHTEKGKMKDKDSISYIQKQIDSMLTAYNRTSNEENNKPKDYELHYLTLTGYPLKDENSRFFISKGTYNLAYVVWDSVMKVGNDSSRQGHYQSKQIPVRYNTDEKKIMIPISSRQYNFIYTSLNIFWIVLIFFSLYIFLGLPIQILINISRGKAFIQKNIRMFMQMAVYIFVYGLIRIIFPYLLRLFLGNKIPNDFASPRVAESIFDNVYIILLAVGLFLISKAFKKGYNLQQEQDLTI